MYDILNWSVKSASIIYAWSQILTFISAIVTGVCVLSMWNASSILDRDSDLRIAQANQKTEELKAIVKWRELSEEDAQKLRRENKIWAGMHINFVCQAGDPEAFYYAKTIAATFSNISTVSFEFALRLPDVPNIIIYAQNKEKSQIYFENVESESFDIQQEDQPIGIVATGGMVGTPDVIFYIPSRSPPNVNAIN